MRNYIFQVSKSSIPPSEQMHVSDIPDYCFGNAFDDVTKGCDREHALRQLSMLLGSGVSEETITVSKEMKRRFFQGSYERAGSYLKQLAVMSFDSYCGDNSVGEPAFESVLGMLQREMEPHGTILIFDPVSTVGEPWTIDKWLRSCLDYDEEESVFFIGGILVYHI